MKICATTDDVLTKIRDLEKMNPEKLRKVLLAPLKLKQDKAMPRAQNDPLVCYFQ